MTATIVLMTTLASESHSFPRATWKGFTDFYSTLRVKAQMEKGDGKQHCPESHSCRKYLWVPASHHAIF